MKTTLLFAAACLAVAVGFLNVAGAAEADGPAIETLAGTGKPSTPESAKTAPPLEFAMDNPFGMETFDRDQLLICEFGGHRILKFDRTANRIDVFAGTG